MPCFYLTLKLHIQLEWQAHSLALAALLRVFRSFLRITMTACSALNWNINFLSKYKENLALNCTQISKLMEMPCCILHLINLGGGGEDVCKLGFIVLDSFLKKTEEGLCQTSCATCFPAAGISSSSAFRITDKCGNMVVISGYYRSNKTVSSFSWIMNEVEIGPWGV